MSCHRRRNRGGTRGTCPPLVEICLLVPPLKLSGTVTFLTIPCHWNMCSDGSVIPEHGERCSKTLGPGILAASNPNINLSTNMASEAISEYLILKIFLREHAPTPPHHHHQCPPNRKYTSAAYDLYSW